MPIRWIATLWVAAVLAIAGCDGERPDPEPEAAASPDARQPLPEDNPLLSTYLTPFRTPPFHRLEPGHFKPALETAMDAARDEIEAIASREAEPDFANTIEALETAGRDVSRIAATFFGLNAALGGEQLNGQAATVAESLAGHNHWVLSHPQLIERVKAVFERRDGMELEPEQARLLELTWQAFQRAGALQGPGERERLAEISAELARLGEDFDRNLRQATIAYSLLVDDPEAIEGLPQNLVAAAERAAQLDGHPDAWLFTLHAPSREPFLRHSPRRDLREEIHRAWSGRARRENGFDNRSKVIRIAQLRHQRARLLGYDHHAKYALAHGSAGGLDAVDELFQRIWEPALARARTELADIHSAMEADGIEGEVQTWDIPYYVERIRSEQFDFDEAEFRAFLTADQVREGAFTMANRLWRLSFHERTDFPQYHTDLRAFEVRDADGAHLGAVYLDYFHRDGKRPGAWTSTYRPQGRDNGDRFAPVVANVTSFAPAVRGQAVLLGVEEARTVFHEFGHALHGLLSDVRYPSLAGTALPRDFVEFPARLMENWATAPGMLRLYAFHHETGQAIPDRLVEQINQARSFGQGIRTVAHLAAVWLDLAWHTRGGEGVESVEDFEAEVLAELDLPAAIEPEFHSAQFAEIFTGDHAAGYYGQMWAAVLEADAFTEFEQQGLFNPDLAARLREEIFSRGNAREPMESWRAFMGRDPEIEPMLERRGLLVDH